MENLRPSFSPFARKIKNAILSQVLPGRRNNPRFAVVSGEQNDAYASMYKGVALGISSEVNHASVVHIAGSTHRDGDNRISVLRDRIGDAVQGGAVDVFFTTGFEATDITETVCREFGAQIPIVFVGPHLVCRDELMERMATYPMTGLLSLPRDYFEDIGMLFKLIKTPFKRVLVLHSVSNERGIEYEANAAICALKEYGCDVSRTALLQSGKHLQEKLSAVHPATDMIFIPRDAIILNHTDIIIQFCNERGLPLVTSDISSVIQGAAIGVGTPDQEIGEAAVKVAKGIVKNHCMPEHVEMRAYSHWTPSIALNFKAAKKQGIVIDGPRVMELGSYGFMSI